MSKGTGKVAGEESLYLSEQRKFRRLEVSLPLWLAEAETFDKGGAQWQLGYTRDVSLGGTKVIVPGDIEKWKALSTRSAACLLRYDAPGCSPVEYIPARIKHAAREDNGRVWLGIEYEEGAESEKAAALHAGLKTLKSRRHWQSALVLALVVIGLGTTLIGRLRGDIVAQNQKIAKIQKARQDEMKRLTLLSGARLVSTRAEGINSSFQRKDVQAQIRKLTAEMSRLNNPNNKEKVEQERAAKNSADDLQISSAPASGVNVNLGVALPYGYAWPQVIDNLEQLLSRPIPTVVVFQDFSSKFPLADAREARVRTKTLQITWEPWDYSKRRNITLRDIARGKHDKYIDSWANASKSFGGEVWIRFAHEFNGNWYPWSTSANGKSEKNYIAAWRHIHDRFTRAGAFNVRWIWCMNAETVPNASWNDPLRAYPGDSYVDMISIDGYNFGTSLSHSRWLSFAEVFAIPYSRAARRFPNKPLMIGETGCATVGGPSGSAKDKADWILKMDQSLQTIFPRISGVVWFDVQKEADWRMASSLETLAASRTVWNKSYYQRGVT